MHAVQHSRFFKIWWSPWEFFIGCIELATCLPVKNGSKTLMDTGFLHVRLSEYWPVQCWRKNVIAFKSANRHYISHLCSGDTPVVGWWASFVILLFPRLIMNLSRYCMNNSYDFSPIFPHFWVFILTCWDKLFPSAELILLKWSS